MECHNETPGMSPIPIDSSSFNQVLNLNRVEFSVYLGLPQFRQGSVQRGTNAVEKEDVLLLLIRFALIQSRRCGLQNVQKQCEFTHIKEAMVN